VLSAGGRPVAIHFGLRSAATLACWFPSYDVALAKYSPGLMLHLFMVEAAATAGVHRLDLGKGDEEYKTVLGTSSSLWPRLRRAAVRGRSGPPGPACPTPVRHRLHGQSASAAQQDPTAAAAARPAA
jgi:CelD/BcsL family acetyltransferase involved in cellulose biosynthesis